MTRSSNPFTGSPDVTVVVEDGTFVELPEDAGQTGLSLTYGIGTSIYDPTTRPHDLVDEVDDDDDDDDDDN